MINNVITKNFTYTRLTVCLKLVLEKLKKSWKSHGIFSQKRCMNPAFTASVFDGPKKVTKRQNIWNLIFNQLKCKQFSAI